MWRRESQRGVVLAEVLVALTIFAGAAIAVMSMLQGAMKALERDALALRAMDVAKSQMSKLETGEASLSELREGRTAQSEEKGDGANAWVVSVRTSRSEYQGLVKVEVEVGIDGARGEVLARLVQLVKLDGEIADDGGESS